MKIKIAVEVGFNDEGDPYWQASGGSGEDDFDECIACLGELNEVRRYWITAEVPDPVKAEAEIPEIAAEAVVEVFA